MLTAHRHLSRQLAQQSESGAHAAGSWAARPPPHEREVLADELYSQGCTHVSGLPTRHPATAWIAARTPPRTPPRTPAQAPGSNAGSPARAGGLAPLCQLRRRRARHGHRPATPRWRTIRFGRAASAPGLALSAGLFWALFAISLARRIETSASRDISQRARLAPGADASPSGSCGSRKRRPGLVDAPPPGRRHGRGAERADRVAAKRDPPRRRHLAAEPQVFHGPFPRGAERPDRRGGRPPAHVPPARPGQINRHLSRAFTDQWLRSSADRLRRLVDAQRLPGAAGPDRRLRFRPVDAAQQRTQAGVLAVRREPRRYACRWAYGWCRWALAMYGLRPATA